MVVNVIQKRVNENGMAAGDNCNFVICSYDEAYNIEIQFHETIQRFAFPATVLCLSEELEDRYLCATIS